MLSYALSLVAIGGLYLLLAQALNLQYGFAGLANFGVVGFYAIGAYTSALLSLGGVPGYVSVAVAGAAGGLASFVVGRVSLRLRADYFGIVMLSVGEIVRITILAQEGLTNGPRGIAGIAPLSLAWSPAIDFAVLIVAANVVMGAATLVLARSPFGRSVRAMRDDEPAFAAAAKDPMSYKMRVFCLGGVVMSVAGALYAHYIGYISPDQFLPITTFYVWIAVIVGGAGRLTGAIAGALILTLFLEGSRFLGSVLPVFTDVEMASARIAAIGLGLMLMAVLRPQGLMGDYTTR